jgi:predicted RNA binding protein YcfA (HicA-like mRNA interferase family)
MTKREKRLKKLRQNPKNISFDDLKQVLEDYGFILDRVVGSHHIFRAVHGERSWRLTIPMKHPIKSIYVKQSITAIDEIQSMQPGQDTALTEQGAEDNDETED